MFKYLSEIWGRLIQGMPEENLETEIQEINLKRGESQKIMFPKQLDDKLNFKIVKWNFHTGQIVKNGDVICVIENDKKLSMEFQSFMKGRLNYRLPENQKLNYKSIIAEIVSVE